MRCTECKGEKYVEHEAVLHHFRCYCRDFPLKAYPKVWQKCETCNGTGEVEDKLIHYWTSGDGGEMLALCERDPHDVYIPENADWNLLTCPKCLERKPKNLVHCWVSSGSDVYTLCGEKPYENEWIPRDVDWDDVTCPKCIEKKPCELSEVYCNDCGVSHVCKDKRPYPFDIPKGSKFYPVISIYRKDEIQIEMYTGKTLLLSTLRGRHHYIGCIWKDPETDNYELSDTKVWFDPRTGIVSYKYNRVLSPNEGVIVGVVLRKEKL